MTSNDVCMYDSMTMRKNAFLLGKHSKNTAMTSNGGWLDVCAINTGDNKDDGWLDVCAINTGDKKEIVTVRSCKNPKPASFPHRYTKLRNGIVDNTIGNRLCNVVFSCKGSFQLLEYEERSREVIIKDINTLIKRRKKLRGLSVMAFVK